MNASGKKLWLVLGLLALLVSPGATVGQEKEDPIYIYVKNRLRNADRPFTLVVSLQVKEGQAKKLETVFAKAIQATRKEKGCRAYDLSRDADDPTRYQVYERWQGLAALKQHLATPHVKTLLAELPALLEGAPSPRVLLPAAE